VIVDELILKLQADLGDIKKSLAQVEAQGKETGKKTGQGFADAFNAIVGGALAAKVTGFLRSSVTEFNKLEKTLLGLQATAKLTGNSFEALKKSVQTLSSDGVLSIDQASTSMKTLIAQGIQADKAFQLLDAAKKVSSFNNIVGDAGQGVADFVKFLQTGSAELAENMDPSIVKVVKSLGGYAKVSSDATAKQKLINAVIEKGGKLAGDYEKFLNSGAQAQVRFDGATLALSQTLGQKLQPAFTAIINGLTKVVTFFTDLIGSMDSLTAAVLAFSTTGFLAIASFAKGAALLPGVFGSIGASITAALGPIGLFVAGISAAVIIVGKLRREWGTSQTRDMLNERDALIQQIGALQNVAGKTKELNDAKAKLLELNKQITTNYAQYLKYLDAENLSIEKKIGLIDVLEKAEKRLTFDKDIRERSADELRAKAKELDAEIVRGNTLLAKGQISRARYDEELGKVVAERAIIGAALETKAGPAAMSSAASGGGKLNQVRFIEAQERLKEIEKARRDTERAARNDSSISNEERRRRIDAAKENAKILAETEIGQLRQVYAEFIEDKYQADLEGLKRQENEAIASVRRQVEAGKLDKEKAEKQIQKIREKGIQKEAALAAKSMAETLQAANATASGLAQIRSGNVGGGIGAALQGISGFDKENSILQTAGFVGQGLSAIVGIGNAVSGLFGKSEEELQRIATEQKLRDEEALKILELQANYQKNMLALQEAAAKLPFEDLQRQMRLADIEAQQRKLSGEDAAVVDADTTRTKLALAQGTLTSQSGKIGEGIVFGGTGSTPDELIAFLSQRAAQSAAIGQFLQLLDVVGSNTLSPAQYAEVNAQLRSYKGKIPDELYNAARGTVINFDGTTSLQDENSLGYGGSRTEYADGIAITTIKGSAEKINAARRVASEISADTGIAENLLSVIEQSNALQLEIAANTKKTAENTSQLLRPDRQRSFIDVGQGFISSLGQRISPSAVGIARSLSQQGLSLPSEIGLASTTSTLAKTLQERMAEAMEMQVRNGARANDLLSGILRATIELYRVMDGNPATVSGFDNAAADAWLADRERRRF